MRQATFQLPEDSTVTISACEGPKYASMGAYNHVDVGSGDQKKIVRNR